MNVNDRVYLLNVRYVPSTGYGVMMLVNNAGAIIDEKVYEKPDHYYRGYWAGSLLKIDLNYYVGCEASYPAHHLLIQVICMLFRNS